MTRYNKKEVGRGAAYIYIESVTAAITGYGLWFILSKITTASVIGTASTVISISAILTTVVGINIPFIIPRFLGKSFSEQKFENARTYVKASLFIISVAVIVSSMMILLLRDYWIFRSLDFNLIIITIALSASGVIALHLRYIIISTLKTRTLVFREIIFSITKIGLAIVLILLGMGAAGITISYVIAQILVSILLGTTILSILKSTRKKNSEISFYQSSKNILAAGIPSWISALITTLGSQLGTIVVYQSAGASPAGAYFLAFSIVAGVTTVMYSLLTATFPALSAMTDGRKRFAWHLTKLSLLFSLPFSSSIIFYSKQIMELFGRDYVQGTSSLEILLLSVMPSAVTTGLNILVYSYGNYRQVLMIGLGSSIPRAVLYFVLVPIYGSNGSAMSYTIGSILGFIVSIMIAKKIGMQILWKDLGYMLLIPIAIGFIVSQMRVYYITGIFITLIVSYILLLKLRVISRLDVGDTFGILPHSISVPVVNLLNKLGEKLNRSY